MIRIVPVLLALMLCAAPSMARTAGIDVNKIPKVKALQAMPPDVFEKQTKEIKETSPYDESLLSYRLRLPTDWTNNIQTQEMENAAGGVSLSDSVLGILGRYIGPPKNMDRSYVTVEGQGMTYEISALHWFLNFILLNGFSLTAMTEVSHKEIEALYVQVDNDQTYVVRVRVIINGNRLVMIRYYLPQDSYDEEKALQAQVVSSFKLTNPTNDWIEKQQTYGFLDQSYFNYPDSWKLKEKSILSIERMSALLLQERKDGKKFVLDGHIKINVISRLLKTTMADEISKFRNELVIKDYSVGDLIENIKYDYDPSIKMGKAQVYKLVPVDKVNMQSYELLVTVMQGDDYYYITSMITPSREQDFYTWARNMEAAKIVNESMRRFDVPKVDPNDPYYDYLKDVPADPVNAPPQTIPPQPQAR